MATQELDQLGAADFAIVEFPEGNQYFSGEVAETLAD